jgi:hypothetical protein
LDFYHLKENLYKFSNYINKEDAAKSAAWVEPLLTMLKNGQVKEVLEELKIYEGTKYPMGVLNPYTYLTNNKNKVDYGYYKRQGWYIGSGR